MLAGRNQSFLHEAVSDLLDAGVKRVSAHQLMLLHGAPLSTPESRSFYQFDTRFRVVARNIGNYTGEPVIEVEEMVVATPDFSFQDYMDIRVFHLLLTIFYYEGNFEEAFEFPREQKLKPFDLVCQLQSMLDQAPAGFRQLIADFLRESKEELFQTREDCIAWSRQNFAGLIDGAVGGNLLSKYSMAARLYQAPRQFLSCTALLRQHGRPLVSNPRGASPDGFRVFAGSLAGEAPFSVATRLTPVWVSHYDVTCGGRTDTPNRSNTTAFRWLLFI